MNATAQDASTRGNRDVFPRPNHDEMARQRYAMGLRQYLFGPLRESVGKAFKSSIAPGYEAREGRPLTDLAVARRELLGLPSYQFFCDLHRVSQDMIWNSVIDTLDRAGPELKAAYHRLAGQARGSLDLHPDLPVPDYLEIVDIHCMPGSYQRSTGDDDLVAGALYDRGGYLYSPGSGPERGGLGHTSLNFLRQAYPDFSPRRILDMGCGVGGPTAVHAEAFPQAELHAIDIGAALLRYGHLRAESMGRVIHFSQQDAEHTSYPDGSFDLVMSHIMFHETAAHAVPRILAECRRLLAPGGVMLHLELPPLDRLPDTYTRIIFDGDSWYNNEPFWMREHDLDWPAMLRAAGFAPEHIQIKLTPVQVQAPPSAGDTKPRWVNGPFALTAFTATVPAR
mgnify:FL=1